MSFEVSYPSNLISIPRVGQTIDDVVFKLLVIPSHLTLIGQRLNDTAITGLRCHSRGAVNNRALIPSCVKLNFLEVKI